MLLEQIWDEFSLCIFLQRSFLMWSPKNRNSSLHCFPTSPPPPSFLWNDRRTFQNRTCNEKATSNNYGDTGETLLSSFLYLCCDLLVKHNAAFLCRLPRHWCSPWRLLKALVKMWRYVTYKSGPMPFISGHQDVWNVIYVFLLFLFRMHLGFSELTLFFLRIVSFVFVPLNQ